MDRTRVFALGAGMLAVAMGAGLVVQHVAPPEHPARERLAWLEMTEEDICESELEDLAATLVPVAGDVAAAEAMHGAMAGLGWGGAPQADAEAMAARMSMPGMDAADGPAMEADGPRFAAAAPEQAAGATMAAGMGFVPGSALWSLPETAPARPEPPGPQSQGRSEPTPAASGALAAGPGCMPRLRLGAAPGAMIALVLEAPCQPEARVVVRHAGLAVTGRTSALGRLEMALPALAEEAQVTVALPGPATVSARVTVPDLPDYDRVAVQWQGADSFQLHAYEFGAAHGTAGHVSGADPADPQRATDGIGGFLTVLGDSSTDWPLLAEVYSFPAARLSGAGEIALVLEAAITEETCGRPLMGEALEVRRGAQPVATDIDVTIPGCEAVGGYVQLKRMLSGLTLARN